MGFFQIAEKCRRDDCHKVCKDRMNMMLVPKIPHRSSERGPPWIPDSCPPGPPGPSALALSVLAGLLAITCTEPC